MESGVWSRTPSTTLLQQSEPANPAVVWTGHEFIIWDQTGRAGHYNPSTGSWKAGAYFGKPSINQNDLGTVYKYLNTYAWAGEEMLAHEPDEGLFSYRPKCLNTERRRIIGSCDLHPDHWMESSWLGWFHDLNFPWIFHAQHQWMYTAGIDGDWIALWDGAMGWLLTQRDTYPNLFHSNSGHWLFYWPGSAGPRWFYDYNTGQWISV
jgi:hypothetical protein